MKKMAAKVCYESETVTPYFCGERRNRLSSLLTHSRYWKCWKNPRRKGRSKEQVLDFDKESPPPSIPIHIKNWKRESAWIKRVKISAAAGE